MILREPSVSYDYGQYKIDNYHDKTFKNLFTNKKEAVKFINKHLEIEETESALKEENIEKCNTEFLTKNKEKLESDIIYRKRETQIYILIEQQSTVDYSMPKRILEYCVEIMREIEKTEKIDYRLDKLPVIYPIVLYTGKGRWQAKTKLAQMQEELKGVENLITSSYILVDVNNYTKEELIKERSAISKAMLMEKLRSGQELLEALDEVLKEPLTEEEKNFIIDLLTNVAREKIGEKKYQELMEKLLGKGGKNMVVENLKRIWDMTYEEGKENGIRQVAIQMVKGRMSDRTIKAMTKISDEELQKIKQMVKTSN